MKNAALYLLLLAAFVSSRPDCAYGHSYGSVTGTLLSRIVAAFEIVAYDVPTDEIIGWDQVHPLIMEDLLELTEKFSFIPLEQRRHAIVALRRFGSRQPVPAQIILISHQPETVESRVRRWVIVGFPGLEKENEAHLIKDYRATFLHEEVVQELLERTGIEIPEPVRYHEITDADFDAYLARYPQPERVPPTEEDWERVLGFPPSAGPTPAEIAQSMEPPKRRPAFHFASPSTPTNTLAVSGSGHGPAATGGRPWWWALAALVGFGLGYCVQRKWS